MKNRYCFLKILCIVISCSCFGQGNNPYKWEIRPINIKTQWADKVNPLKTLTEYPRPRMQRESWVNLNGLWEYCITDSIKKMPTKFDGKILVPFPLESALSGVKIVLQPSQSLWYRRQFQKPENRNTGRLLLHFGAVDYQTDVYINGIWVGSHKGGYTAFSFDITDFVKENNELVVKVLDPSNNGIGPHGKQVLNPDNIYYTSVSGIWQTVWLESVPSLYIKSFNTGSDIDKNEASFTLDVNTESSDCKIQILLKSDTSLNGLYFGPIDTSICIKVNKPHLWSTGDPFLYDVYVKLIKNNIVIDSFKSYLGMRKVSIRKDSNGIDRFYLNNNYLYNLGVLDQGYWPDGLYTAPTDDALAFDIAASKAMGFNTIRKHAKIEPERWYYHADKLGMMVWQDFVGPNQSLPRGAKMAFESELKETVDQLKSHTCITSWVIFNEKWGSYDQQRITEWLKKYDKSRLVNGHSGELLYVNNVLRSPSPNAYVSSDMIDLHSYPYPRIGELKQDKLMVLGEYGGIGVPIFGHLWDDLALGWGYNGLWGQDSLKVQYSEMIDSLVKYEKRGLSASIYTQPFDVESEQNGLITYDRKVLKIPLDTIRKINSKILQSDNDFVSFTKYFLESNIRAISIDKYDELIRTYQQWSNDSMMLRSILLMASSKKDIPTIKMAITDYLKVIKSPLQHNNIKLIVKFTKSTTDPSFSYVQKHAGEIDSVLGKNTAENLIMSLIYKDEIAPYDKERIPNWSQIEKSVRRKYGKIGEEQVWGNMMVYYYGVSDWKAFGRYYKLYFDRAIPQGRSFIHINNLSWPVFEHIGDTSILLTAIMATKHNIDVNVPNDPSAIDTYANLLFKIGRRKEAINWEQKAVILSNNEDIFVKTLNKMKSEIALEEKND